MTARIPTPPSFDETLEATAPELDEAAGQVLADPEIQGALDNGDHDDAW